MPMKSIILLNSFFFSFFSWMFTAEQEKVHNEEKQEKVAVHAPFNVQYNEDQLGEILSYIDTKAALSATGYHKGLLIAPLGFDHGGGRGKGAFAAYNIDDPRNPVTVFDSRDYPDKYHNQESKDYLGDVGEVHGIYLFKDYLLLPRTGFENAGFLILDLAPLYDNDDATLPSVVSSFDYPYIGKVTDYDGLSFASCWVGGEYVYAPTGAYGLFVVSTKNLANPRLVKHMRKSELYNATLRSAHALGSTLVLSPAATAVKDNPIVLLDISNPFQPSLINQHPVEIGYQGIVYGSRFYAGSAKVKGNDEGGDILAYDFADPNNIKTINLGNHEGKLHKMEYLYLQDDNLYMGHYPGLSKWKVEGDKATLEMEITPQFPPKNDYAFISPLGNLSVVTSDHIVKSRLNIGISQLAPDTKSPEVKYIIPRMNAKNVGVTTAIGISFSEFLNDANLSEDAIYLKQRGRDQKVPCKLSHGMGIAHVLPISPLKNNSAYELYITPQLTDIVGNPYQGDGHVLTFYTGQSTVDYNTEIIKPAPAVVNTKLNFSAKVYGKASSKDLLYAWDFGDGTSTPFSSSSSTSKRYSKAGNYQVLLSTKSKGSDKIHKISSVQIVYAPSPSERPSSSASMCLNEDHSMMYVVNPDNHTLTGIDLKNSKVVFEKKTANHPISIAVKQHELWVSCKEADKLMIHSADNGNQLKSISLPYGSAPHGVVLNHQKSIAYVALSSLGEVVEIDTKKYEVSKSVKFKGPLRNLSFVPTKNIVIAPQFIASNQLGSYVQWYDITTGAISYQERLAATTYEDGISNGRGYPNYLGAMAVNPQQTHLWLPGKKDNLFRGISRDGEPLTFDHTVRSVAMCMNLSSSKEEEGLRIDLDNSDFATAATYGRFGNMLYIATMGTATIWAIDVMNPSNQSIINSYGEGAMSMVADANGFLYVHNQLSRVVSVFRCHHDGRLEYIKELKTVSNELLAPEVLAGKRIFHNTIDPALSLEGYMSCASCHVDGGHDGRNWDLTNLGEGIRNTIDLRGKAGMKHGLLHWTGNFDEIHDFDIQLQKLNGGEGYRFVTDNHETSMVDVKYGLNNRLDELSAYISSLATYPKSMYKSSEGEMTVSALAGKKHFVDLNCVQCHPAPLYTDSYESVLHDVGTITSKSGQRISKELKGFDTPTLIGLANTAPYLHDGSAQSLMDVFKTGKGEKAKAHQCVLTLDTQQQEELIDFLLQLDSEEKLALTGENKSPQFLERSPTFQFTFNGSRKQNFGKVSAKDEDINQTLSYYVLPGEYAASFDIDADGKLYYVSGDIYQLRYHKQKTQEFWFKVMVKDNHPSNPKTDVVEVKVNVEYRRWELSKSEVREYAKYIKKIKNNISLTETEKSRFDEFENVLNFKEQYESNKKASMN